MYLVLYIIVTFYTDIIYNFMDQCYYINKRPNNIFPVRMVTHYVLATQNTRYTPELITKPFICNLQFNIYFKPSRVKI